MRQQMPVPNAFPIEGHLANFTRIADCAQVLMSNVESQILFRVVSLSTVGTLVLQFHRMTSQMALQGSLRSAPQPTIITDERLVSVALVFSISFEHFRTTGFLTGVHSSLSFLVHLLMSVEVTFEIR